MSLNNNPPPYEIVYQVLSDSPLSKTAEDLLSSGILNSSQTSAVQASCSTGIFDNRSLCALREGLLKRNSNLSDEKTIVLDLIKSSSAKAHVTRQNNLKKDEKSRLEEVEEAKTRRRNELFDRQAHREYAELTSSVRRVEEKNTQAAGFKLYSQQMSLGMSLLVTLISAVLLGFFAGRQMFGVERPGAALTVAAIAGTSLFIVEAILMISRLSRVDAKAHKKERVITTALTRG
jgi:hypothetical protein